MSFDGHVLCQRMLIGPDWAFTAGAATVAAAVAPAAMRNLRRLAVFESGFFLIRRPSLGLCRRPGGADRRPFVITYPAGSTLFRRVVYSFTGLPLFHKP